MSALFPDCGSTPICSSRLQNAALASAGEGARRASTVACGDWRTYASWPTVDAQDHLDAWSFDMGAALSDVARFLRSLSNTAGAVDDRRSVVVDSCSRGDR